MPEFEEHNHSKKETEAYSPRNESKPRSRRRSGGFKNDSAPTQELNIGEIDPNSIPADVTSEQPETVNEAPAETSSEAGKPEPKKKNVSLGQDTLRVIQELEEKIAEKKNKLERSVFRNEAVAFEGSRKQCFCYFTKHMKGCWDQIELSTDLSVKNS